MKMLEMSLKDAYQHVKTLRPAIGPHHHLKNQLIVYEKDHLKRENSFETIHEWIKVSSKHAIPY